MTERTPTPEEEDDMLAAEYVAGLLDAAARAGVAERMARDRVFAERVEAWEIRLGDLNDGYGEAAPPATVKTAIDARLFGPEPGRRRSLWSSARFWRGFSIGTLASIAALVLALSLTPPAPADRFVATLEGEGGAYSLVAIYDAGEGAVRIAEFAAERAPDRDLELWLIAGEAAPVSLGLIRPAEDGAIILTGIGEAAIAEGATLAVSLEPAGGSPTGQPTGPVVAAGSVKKI